MSESAVQVQSGPSLEQILWGAVERWSQTDVPSVTDREEFAARITEAWGGDTPTEEFLAHFFGEDRSPSAGDAADMAEAIVKATRDRMFVYEFDLNHLEYVVVEGDDDVMTVVGDMGQFQFNVDDTVRSLVEAAIIPDSYNPVGSGGEYDRNKNQGQPKAYLLRSTGEMVAVNVQAITRAIALGASLRQVEAPMVDRPALNLAPFAPRKTRVLTAEREARILRQDSRLRSTSQADFLGTKSRDRIMSLAAGGAGASAALSPPPPMSADTTVFLLMPDGTLAQPMIGSATRWREMVSDWTARAAFISMGGTTAPVAVASGEQRFVVQGASVVAMFTGGQSNQASSSAPGAVGFAAEASGIGVMAARSQIAPIRVLSDEDLARAVAGGAQLVSGLTANIVQADGHTSVGFWMQPEALFAPSTQDMQLVQGTTTPSGPASSGSSELDQLLADVNGGNPAQLGQVTGDPWADWALQAGGKLNPGELLLAARNRPQAAPGAYGGAVSADGDVPAGPRIGPGGTLQFPGSKLMAFRAPDGSVISARGSFPVRLAQAGRSLDGLGLAPDFAQAGGLRGQIPLAARSGALPATALAALSMALERTANAVGYKLPFVRIESATNAIGDGDQIAMGLPADHPLRSEARLMGSPLIDGQTTRLVLSMPFPNSGEVHVGSDLSDALQSYVAATAVPSGAGGMGGAGANSMSASGFGGAGLAAGAGLGAVGGGALAMALSRGPNGQLVVGGAPGSSAGGWTFDPGGDFSGLHGEARAQAQQAYLQLQQPGVIDLIQQAQGGEQQIGLQQNGRIAGLPALLRSAIDGSGGGWMAGPGAEVPSGVQKFAFSGPFGMPELVEGQPQAMAVGPRPIGAGEDEIEIPLPLWAQMGRGQISATNQVLASARARAGYAPPLGVYRLVSPQRQDLAAEGQNALTIAGPTGISFESPSSPQGGAGELVTTQARQLGGRYVLGRVPLADDAETYEVMGGASPQARARAQSKLGALDPARADAGPGGAVDGISGSSSSSMSGSIGSDGADVGFGGGKAGSLPSLGGDAPQGALVAGAPSIPQVPQVDLPGLGGLGSTGSASQSVMSAAGEAAPGRPMAGALNSALQFSNDIGNRALPSGGLPGGSSPAMFSGALGGGSGGAGSLATGGGSGLGGLGGGLGGSPGSLVTGGGQTLASGGGEAFGASASGSSFGSLGSSAPQGSYVATQSPAAQAAADVRRQVAESSARLDSGGIPSSALTGARRDAPGYQDWSYGTTSSRDPVSASSRVDISSGLGKPQYPSLPSTLRFRYIGAPLWWSGRAGGSMAGSDGDSSDPESQSSSASRALRAGLRAASSAASIWRSILVSPSRGGGDAAGSSGGGMDRGWDSSAEQMSSTSSRMDGYAASSGALVGGVAGGVAAKGAETVYVALDGSKGGVTTASEAQQARAASVNMSIVAAIPPAPPPLETMGAGGEARARHHGHGHKGHGHAHEESEGGASASKIEGSVDAVAQRILHRIRARLMFDRERFNG